MKIFIDVGTHQGQTINSILAPMHGFDRFYCRYGFDRIYGFEPVPELHHLVAARFRHPRFTFYPAGVWTETCERTIYSPGTQSGSIFPDKINVDPSRRLTCKFLRASEWFHHHITETDRVYMTLNCEGSEVDIIEDLLDANEYHKITSLAVTFDVRKIPSQRHREETTKLRLRTMGFANFVDLAQVEGVSRRERIANWLSMCGANRVSFGERLRYAAYRGRILAARVRRYADRHQHF
jgi:hypothetical protein